jgi:aldose 1-epimerase
LRLLHQSDADWPYAFTAELDFQLVADGLTVTSSLKNDSDAPMPYGLGLHPYIKRPAGTKLYASVKGVWLTDDTVMPTSFAATLPAAWNLPAGCPLDGVFMDNCFAGLEGAVRVAWPDGANLTIAGGDKLRFLVVYNPPAEDYVCVEPVSHMTDAVNRFAAEGQATGFTVLAPGARASCTHRFTYQGPQAA